MDVLDELKKIKDETLKEEVKKAVVTTLKNADEELYFEEETAELASREYIKSRLVKIDNHYYVKVTNEGPFCINCWEKNGELVAEKKDGDDYLCTVCKVASTYKK